MTDPNSMEADKVREGVVTAWEQHRSSLSQYIDLLEWWNPRLNLLSRDVSRETIEFHIRHSLHLLPFLEEETTVVDMGTGGGLPGMVLAISDPTRQYVLNDIQQKKCMALKQMIQHLGLANAVVSPGDVKSLRFNEPVQWVSKHAFKMDQLMPEMPRAQWSQMAILKGLGDIHAERERLAKEAFQHHVVDLHAVWMDERYAGKGLWLIRRRDDEGS